MLPTKVLSSPDRCPVGACIEAYLHRHLKLVISFFMASEIPMGGHGAAMGISGTFMVLARAVLYIGQLRGAVPCRSNVPMRSCTSRALCRATAMLQGCESSLRPGVSATLQLSKSLNTPGCKVAS